MHAPGLQTQIGGNAVVNQDINDRVSADIARAETISMPILLVLLVLIFGSFAAASLPLAIGVTAILGAFTALRAFALFTDVSIFAVNIVTITGLGLAIDYGLFVVSRFREEIRRQPDVETALARTMATAGRTVAVSGVTVAISVAGLLIFPQVFLRSMGFGGMSAVLIAMIAALTLLPALLAMLGPKVDALSVRPWLRRAVPAAGRAAVGHRARALVPDRAQRDAPAGRLRRRRHRAAGRPGAAVPAGAVRRHRRPGAAGGPGEPDRRRDDRPRLPAEHAGPDHRDRDPARRRRLPRRQRGAAVLRRRGRRRARASTARR